MVILEVQGGDVGEGAAVFYGVLAAIAVLLFVRSRQTYLVVEGTPALVLMKDRPTPHAMREFLARVQARKREYLAEQYLLGTHEGALVDATHKLDTLRKQGSISDTEVEALKADIIRRAQTTHPPQASPN
jgi:hypothetical protein